MRKEEEGVAESDPYDCKMPKVKKTKKRSGSVKSPGVPFASGFRLPTPKQSLRAAKTASHEELEREFLDDPHDPHFSPIPTPTSIDDWLAQYVEEGQTYSQFLRECPWLSTRKIKRCRMPFRPSGKVLSERYPDGKIYLLPLGEFDAFACAPKFSDLAEYASVFFSLKVEVLPAIRLEVDRLEGRVFWLDTPPEGEGHHQGRRKSGRVTKHRLEARFDRGSGRYQLQADSLVNWIDLVMPADALCLVALTMSDIYQSPSDLFVAGLAGVRHRVGVFSLKRYDPTATFSTEHWHDVAAGKGRDVVAGKGRETEPSPSDLRTILQRSCKLLVHELSHLLCVDHCIFYSCCMNGSGHLTEDFQQSMHLCPVDLRKLQHLCGFDVRERYGKLGEFFERHGLSAEERWIR